MMLPKKILNKLERQNDYVKLIIMSTILFIGLAPIYGSVIIPMSEERESARRISSVVISEAQREKASLDAVEARNALEAEYEEERSSLISSWIEDEKKEEALRLAEKEAEEKKELFSEQLEEYENMFMFNRYLTDDFDDDITHESMLKEQLDDGFMWRHK